MIETINWLALTVPFIAAGATYVALRERRVPKALAGTVGIGLLTLVFVAYFYLYRSAGFPLWMGWFASVARAEPLPGRPEVHINTKLNADWIIVGMNYDWMVLVAKAPLQIGNYPEIFMRWEHAKPQKMDDGKLYLSEVQQVELDCAGNRWNPLVALSYARNNLSGDEIYSGHGDPQNALWDTPEANSIFAAAVRAGCELFSK